MHKLKAYVLSERTKISLQVSKINLISVSLVYNFIMDF